MPRPNSRMMPQEPERLPRSYGRAGLRPELDAALEAQDLCFEALAELARLGEETADWVAAARARRASVARAARHWWGTPLFRGPLPALGLEELLVRHPRARVA